MILFGMMLKKIHHKKIISHNNIFNEFKIYVSCKINDVVELKIYRNEHDLCELIPLFFVVDTLYVHVAGEKIYISLFVKI